MLSLANARNEEELRAWVDARPERCSRRQGVEDAEIQFVDRAEDRRARDLARLRGRRARARGDARRRRDRRGRDPQPAHDQGDPAARRGRAAAARGARRGLPAARGVRRAQRAARRRRRADLRQPAQLRGRLDPPARSRASPPRGRCRCGPTRSARSRASSSRRQREALEWLREHGFQVNPDIEVHDDVDDVVARCRGWEERRDALDYEIDGVVVKVDDLELQRELGVVGREPRGAIAWKFPPMTATTTLNEVIVERRPHRATWCRSPTLEPVQVVGRHREARDAPQRGGPAPQGRARGRRGDRHARRRRDPAGGLADAEGAEAQGPQPRAEAAEEVPRRAGRRRSSPRAASGRSARTARAAPASCSRPSSTSSAAARWTSRGSGRSGPSASSRRG